MGLFEDPVDKREKLAVVGLGYVGMPLAISFAKSLDTIGFDISKEKIELYKTGIDPTKEVGDIEIAKTNLEFTSDENRLKDAKFYIIAVPTPINIDKTPDLTPVEKASQIVGRNLKKGSVIVYESTVYPGVTEDICIPILERASGLKCGLDFYIGYSPERINPGDKIHRLENIRKIVSGMNEETLDCIANVYEIVVKAGVYRAGSIKVAEDAKVVENSQRDINIAFMNELAMVFDKMGIDTNDVIAAMNTKWNSLGFYPGLVGGHCIGVDPYYFVYEAEKLGYHSQIILAGRKINDGMGEYIGENIIKQLVLANKQVRQCRVAIFGITFKENCPDIRNSKVLDIIKKLSDYGIETVLVDPVADIPMTKEEDQIRITELDDVNDIDCAVFAVAHDLFKQLMDKQIEAMFSNREDTKNVIIDVKGIMDKKRITEMGFRYWSL